MTPQGAGLFVYIAKGGETLRAPDKYTNRQGRDVVVPTSPYFAGEAVEILVQAGYTVLDTKRNIKSFAPRSTAGFGQQQATLEQVTYKLNISEITDVRGGSDTSDLVAFENMVRACSSGTVLFWYPDFDNAPSVVIPCRVSNPSRATRQGHFWSLDLELTPLNRTEAIPLPFWQDRYCFNLSAFGNPVSTAAIPTLNPPAVFREGIRSTGAQAVGLEFNTLEGWQTQIGRWHIGIDTAGNLRVDLWDKLPPYPRVVQYQIRVALTNYDPTARNQVHARYDPAGVTDSDKLTVDFNGTRQNASMTIGGIPTALTPLLPSTPSGNIELRLEAFTGAATKRVNNLYLFDGAAPLIAQISGIKDMTTIPNLWAWYELENNILDSSGNGRHLAQRDINAAQGFVVGGVAG